VYLFRSYRKVVLFSTVTVLFNTVTAAAFSVNRLAWHPSGDALLLLSRDQMCVCFLAAQGRGEQATP